MMKIVPNIRLAIGADHRGFELKQKIIEMRLFDDIMVTWSDCGTQSTERSDYPIFAKKVCALICSNDGPRMGILLCGTGVGMAIAANRFKGIYAAVAWNQEIAKRSREEDWSNVLVLPADYLDLIQSIEIITVWLKSEPKAGQYYQRISMID